MENSVLAQSELRGYAPVAGPLHTISVLAALAAFGGWSFWAIERLKATNLSRVRFYALTLLFEWLLFAFVMVGVWRFGASVLIVLGDHWHSLRQLLRDIGIAVGFWMVATVLLWIFGWLLRITERSSDVRFELPHRGIELTLWVALSVTAGICEETIFRGYLQRQFLALTKNVPAAISFSAVAFGAGHAYQGFRMVLLITLYGAMFGILAHWRRSVRPGMIAHAWQDSLNGVLAAMARR